MYLEHIPSVGLSCLYHAVEFSVPIYAQKFSQTKGSFSRRFVTLFQAWKPEVFYIRF